jgi:hypothetical protein
MSAQSALHQFWNGSQSAPNPRTTQLIPAGAGADVATFDRNDTAFAEDNTIFKNPHIYLMRWILPGLSGPIGRGGQRQIGTFLGYARAGYRTPGACQVFRDADFATLPEVFSYIPSCCP